MSRYFWLKIGVYFIGLGLIAGMASVVGRSNVGWWASGAWCVAAGAPLLIALKRATQSGIQILLTDHLVMLCLAYFIYFVVGTSLLSVGPRVQIDSALTYYNIDAMDAMRVNSVNSIGVGVLIIAAIFSNTNFLGGLVTRATFGLEKIPSQVVIVAFLAIGLYASVSVAAVDLFPSDSIVDGGIRVLAKFCLIAIYLGITYSGPAEKLLRMASVATAILLSFFGLILFNKTEVLLPMGILAVAFSIKYKSPRVLFGGLIALLVIFVLIGNAVAWGRNTYVYGGGNVVTSRLYNLVDGFSEGSDLTSEGEYHAWARICYTPSQVAGMDFYESSNGGGDFELIPWLVVPRALAENKPIISGSGEGVHTKITGNVGSSTGLGIFVSGYYNMGWFGLVVASLICGWIIAQTSRVASEIISRGATAMFPFAFIGVYIAFRVDGNFVVDYIGLFIYLLIAIVAISLVSGHGDAVNGK